MAAFGVEKTFRTTAGAVRALRGVDVAVGRGEIVGVVGESGSGKTVLGEILAGLQQPTRGRVERSGRVQMVFQNPFESLNPRLAIATSVAEPLRFHGRVGAAERAQRVEQALAEVGLSPPGDYAGRFPHECSGGELQRASIARALIGRPELVIADEPTTMLDVSIRAAILRLLVRLRELHGMAVLLISHDFSGVGSVCDRVTVLYRGHVVEQGACGEVLAGPVHPYTEALLAAMPSPDPETRMRPAVRPGGGGTPGGGCVFASRCPHREAACTQEQPRLADLASGHRVACLVRERDRSVG